MFVFFVDEKASESGMKLKISLDGKLIKVRSDSRHL